MEDCKEYHRKISYWVIKAFPENIAIQQQFGIGRVSKVSKSQPKMILFMENLAETIKEYRTELEAASTPAELLDQATSHAQGLRTANIDQEQEKGNRTVTTVERITALNDIYAQLQRISKVAGLIFTDQPEKNKLYQIPYYKSNGTTNNEEEE